MEVRDARHCRACGIQSDVIDSRPVHLGVRRRRRCRQCGERWSTLELRQDDYDPIKAFLTTQDVVDHIVRDLEGAIARLRVLATAFHEGNPDGLDSPEDVSVP